MKNNLRHILNNENFIVVYGNNIEDFLSDFKVIMKDMNKRDEMDIVFNEIYYENFLPDEFANIILSASMLLEKKTILLRNCFKIKDSDAKFINQLVEQKVDSNVLIIDFTDSNESITRITQKAKKIFPNAYYLKYAKPYFADAKYIRERISSMDIDLSSSTIDAVYSIAQEELSITNNILGMAWMINNEEIFKSILNTDLKEDNSPLLHYQFLDEFLLRNMNKCYELYKKIIKWHVLDEDELLTRILSKLREFFILKKEYDREGIESLNRAHKRLPNFIREKKNRQFVEMFNIWTYEDIIDTYRVFYQVKRKMRTLKKTLAIIEFEQMLIKQLRGQYGPKFII